MADRRHRGLRRLAELHSRKAGEPPGTVVHPTVETPTAPVGMTVIAYDADRHETRELTDAGEVASLHRPGAVTWLDVDGVHDIEALETIGDTFDLHPLTVEDIAHPGQRPKLEDYGDYLFLVLRMLTWDETADEVRDEQVSMVLGDDHLISFQERSGDVFDGIRGRLRTEGSQIRQHGPDYLAYRLMDAVVDHYFVLLERIGYRLDELEDELVAEPDEDTLQRIYRTKRELLFVRTSVWPLREVVASLERDESPLVASETRTHLRDVADHTIQVVDLTTTFREMLTGMLDTYLSSVSNRMNEVMKVLTVVATIFIPLTFVVGIYGMNFEHMPELAVPWAYPAVWAVMVAIAGGMLAFFRRRGWI